jgi:transcriptional regulator with PAS, ATPase and Fis domain
MMAIYPLIAKAALSPHPVLIAGESGTGKELVARALHQASGRRAFVTVNCGALPETLLESELFGHEKGAFTGADRDKDGLFQVADGGTLFLDEIAEMPSALQPKLLRVLEGGSVRRLGGAREIRFDVRVLSATNRSPLDAVRDGKLREDLFYRLNVFDLRVPPLRERLDDVPLLAQHFIRDYNLKHGSSIDGLKERARVLLEAYPWPGNVRELRNVIERAVILARKGWIEPGHLPPYLRGGDGSEDALLVLPMGISAAEAERRLILRTLEQVGHNKAEAARRLGLDVKTILNKLKTYEEEREG